MTSNPLIPNQNSTINLGSPENTTDQNPQANSPAFPLKKSRKKIIIALMVILAVLFLAILFISKQNREQRTTAGTSLLTPGIVENNSDCENTPVPTLTANNNFIGLTHGSLGAGGKTSVNIDLSGGVETHFYLSWVGKRPTFTLTKPGGTEINEEYVLENLREVNLESSDTPPRLIYIVYKPEDGVWKMNITADSPIDYQVFATAGSSSGGNTTSPAPVFSPPPGLPSPTSRLLPGNNKVSFTGNVRENRVDRDGNGLYEYLVLFYEIESPDFIDVEVGTILGVENEIVSETNNDIKLKNGRQEIPVIYYGADFLESEINGPYKVMEANIKPKDPRIPRESRQNLYTTSDMEFNQFETIGSNL